MIKKNSSILFDVLVSFAPSNLVYNKFMLELFSLESEKILLNKINKEGIPNKPFKSVLFNSAKIIIQI